MIGLVVMLLKHTIMRSFPILVAALGEVYSERSGVLNLGCEGIIAMGAATGFLATYFSGNPLIGFLTGLLTGMVFGLLHSYLSVTLRINQLISGLSIWILGIGLSSLLYRISIGITTALPVLATLRDIPVPLLSDIPVIGPVLFRQNALIYLMYVMIPVLYVVLFKTSIGLSIRAVGENPRVADTLGINVFRTRYACVLFATSLMGLAGAYLSLVEIGTFTEGIGAGRGWIALALVIFGRWNPLVVFLGSLLFAGLEAYQYQLQLVSPGIPYQFLQMIPYIATIAVLIYAYRRAEAPAALATPYERKELI